MGLEPRGDDSTYQRWSPTAQPAFRSSQIGVAHDEFAYVFVWLPATIPGRLEDPGGGAGSKNPPGPIVPSLMLAREPARLISAPDAQVPIPIAEPQ